MSTNTKSLPNERLYHALYVLSISLMIAAGVVVILLVIWGINWTGSVYSYDDYYVYGSSRLSGSNYFIGYYADWNMYGQTVGRKAVVTFHWMYLLLPAAMLAGGILLWIFPGGTFRHYYRDVLSGRIVYMDTDGGGRSSLEYYVVVEGKTLAGERRQDQHYVDAKTFQLKNIGDSISFL